MSSNGRDLLNYLNALEIEIDRLRCTHVFFQLETLKILEPLHAVCGPIRSLRHAKELVAAFNVAIKNVGVLFRDLPQPSECAIQEEVVAIAARPIIEQVFGFQQRRHSAFHVKLHLELEVDSVEWFSARFQHILHCLLSNAIRYRDSLKGEARVTVGLHTSVDTYVLRVTDNGVGFDWNEQSRLFELLHRIGSDRTGLGVGLAVTKLLVDQVGGTLTVSSGEGQGSSFVAVLPRFDVDNLLESVSRTRSCG